MKQQTPNRSIYKMGAICLFITGFCYFVIAICALYSPTTIASYILSKDYFDDFVKYKPYFILLKVLMAIANATMMGVVISLYNIVNRDKSGWFILLTLLSIAGLSIGMLQSVLDVKQISHLATEFEQVPAIIQRVMMAFGVSDPAIYILSLGLPGIWLIFYYLIYAKKFSLYLVMTGIAWGVGNLIVVVAHLFIIIWLIYFIAGSALIGVPSWTIIQGKYLWKISKKQP